MTSLKFCKRTKYYEGDQIKKVDVGGAYTSTREKGNLTWKQGAIWKT